MGGARFAKKMHAKNKLWQHLHRPPVAVQGAIKAREYLVQANSFTKVPEAGGLSNTKMLKKSLIQRVARQYLQL